MYPLPRFGRLIGRPLLAGALLGGAVAATACAAGQTPPPREDSWTRHDWSPHERPVRDRGTGVVFAIGRGPEGPAARVDTLRFQAEPEAGASPIALVLTEHDGVGGWRYALLSRQSVEPNLLEYGYEEAGVPVDTVRADGWVRGVLAHRENGSPLRGWTRVGPGVAHLGWVEHLPTQMVHLPDAWAGTFHEAPAGAVAASPMDLADVSLHVIEAQPPWLRVRLVSPADACTGPDDRPRAEAVRWIRYLDDRGRPLVWYYTRGC